MLARAHICELAFGLTVMLDLLIVLDRLQEGISMCTRDCFRGLFLPFWGRLIKQCSTCQKVLLEARSWRFAELCAKTSILADGPSQKSMRAKLTATTR